MSKKNVDSKGNIVLSKNIDGKFVQLSYQYCDVDYFWTCLISSTRGAGFSISKYSKFAAYKAARRALIKAENQNSAILN